MLQAALKWGGAMLRHRLNRPKNGLEFVSRFRSANSARAVAWRQCGNDIPGMVKR